MNRRYGLLIHGPLQGNCLEKIGELSKQFVNRFSQIVIVGYVAQMQELQALVDSSFPKDVSILTVKDVVNPGFANINRQILLVRKGLELFKNSDIIIKLRNDQICNFSRLFKILDNLWKEKHNNKILTTNVYTRRDRYYHPSDMFLCARTSVLKEYYSLPLQEYTDLDMQYYVRSLGHIPYSPVSPESMLFRHFIVKEGWQIAETFEDSYKALRKFIYLINSWDIELRWTKARNYPFKQNFEIILPHHFKCSPFWGAPCENVSCWDRSSFCHERRSFRDWYYLVSSYCWWLLWKDNKSSIPLRKKKISRKVKLSVKKSQRALFKLFPYFLVHKRIDKLSKYIHDHE